MSLSENAATIEAMLFACGEPADRARIAVSCGLTEQEVDDAVCELRAHYDASGAGIDVICLEDRYQMISRERFAAPIRTLLDKKKNAPLSSAAFEVLAVIAYNQPVTKAFVEQVRGVDCSGVVATLCQRGLIEEKGRLELPGRPLVYGTTDRFLRCFSLSDLSELPQIPRNEETDALKNANNDASVLDGQQSMM